MKMKKQNLTVNRVYYNICMRHVLFIIIVLEGYIYTTNQTPKAVFEFDEEEKISI